MEVEIDLSNLAANPVDVWRVTTHCNGSAGSCTPAQSTTANSSACPGAYDLSGNDMDACNIGRKCLLFPADPIHAIVNAKGAEPHFGVINNPLADKVSLHPAFLRFKDDDWL